MNTNRIFTGIIMCDVKEYGEYVFIKVSEEEYILLEDINNKLSLASSKILKFSTFDNGSYYIKNDSLKPYYKKNSHKSLRKIKNDYLLDPRNPKGIEY